MFIFNKVLSSPHGLRWVTSCLVDQQQDGYMCRAVVSQAELKNNDLRWCHLCNLRLEERIETIWTVQEGQSTICRKLQAYRVINGCFTVQEVLGCCVFWSGKIATKKLISGWANLRNLKRCYGIWKFDFKVTLHIGLQPQHLAFIDI